MDTIQNKTQKPTIKKSIEDTEIENLDKRRKTLRKKNQTNKTRRTRARRKRKELIQETLEARKGPRQINKHKNEHG